MGERLNRIEKEFVLRSLGERHLPVTARCRSGRVDGVVADVSDKGIVIELSVPVAWKSGDHVELQFVFQNNSHACSTSLIESDGTHLRLSLPENVYKGLQRQFDRVRRPEGFRVSFRLEGIGSVNLMFPLAAEHVEPPRPSADFDQASIKDLADQFNDRVRADGLQGRIVMLRNRFPTGYEESLMQATGKALWIPSTEEDFPARDPSGESRILTKPQLIEYEKSCGTDPALILSRLDDLLYRKRREGIASELYWPLLRERYFIGYLHVSSGDRAKPVGRPLLEWAAQFALVLSFALERSGYFADSGRGGRPYQAEPVDLSASGLLFAHPDKELYKRLLVHSDIPVVLRTRERSMTIGARVVRKFADRDHVYVALSFLEIAPEDFRYLYETLYGRPFDPSAMPADGMGS